MARKQWVALAQVDYLDADGKRQFASPNDKARGLFNADLSEKQAARLLDRQAIRAATAKDLASDDEVIEGEATEVVKHDDELDELKVAELRDLAVVEEVELEEGLKKAEIIAAIRQARVAKAANVGGAADLLG